MCIFPHSSSSLDTCRILEFTEPEAGSYLEHHVIQSTLVHSSDQCKVNCYVEELCLSYNLGLLGSGEKFICELSNSDHYQHPEHIVSKKGFSYHPTATLCAGFPCPPASSCIPDHQGNLRCVCPSYWPKVQNCEREIFDNCYDSAVGIADPSIIPDSQMTASSQFSGYNKPAYGRLDGDRGAGWCAKKSDGKDDWLQVDFGETIQVCAVATQGDRHGHGWVTDFKLFYSLNENDWTSYEDNNGTEVEFHRKGDSFTVNKHMFPLLLSARYIRFHPTKQHNFNCLRVEVYGTKRLFFHWKLDGQDPFVSLYNGASYEAIDGKTALYLDGAPHSHTGTPAIPIQNISFSLLCWIKVLRLPRPERPVHIYSDWSKPHQFRLFVKNGMLKANLRGHSPSTFNIVNFAGGNIVIGEWMHVAFTWSRENRIGKLYINGTEKGQEKGPPGSLDLKRNDHTVFDIGLKRDSLGESTFHGYLRDLMVIDRAISKEELMTIFAWSKI
ncbi:hypothetical protein ACROYT_G003473 [Oculina patagonica]